MKLLQGYKTTLGSVAAILTGLALVVRSLSANDVMWDEVLRGFSIMSVGFAAFGIGHKIERKG